MNILIIFFIVSLIALLPIKKYLSYIFYPVEYVNESYPYYAKNSYLTVGQISYLLPFIDFIKAPILYFCLKNLNLLYYLYVAIIILIILWCYGYKKDPVFNRGTSFFLGIFLIINLSIFQLLFVIYASILLLTRYQSMASYFFGMMLLPVIILINFSLFNMLIGSMASYITLSNYKNSFISIFSKTFFHLSR